MDEFFTEGLNSRLALALAGRPAPAWREPLSTIVRRATQRPQVGVVRRTRDGTMSVDAEGLLEVLEGAAAASPEQSALARWKALAADDAGNVGFEAPTIAKYCRKYIATCCVALVRTSGEVAEPYRRWARELRPSDTVITFNYDRIVESVAEGMVTVVRPCQRIEKLQRPLLLKLHGSVDWVDGSYDEYDPWRIIDDKNLSPFLAAPGPVKATASLGPLGEHWHAAAAAISAADAIVFIGYRFAQGDAHARLAIAQALKRAYADPLAIRVVLGPKKSEDVQRTMGLAKWAANLSGLSVSRFVAREPMWAEDFLSVFDRERLTSKWQ